MFFLRLRKNMANIKQYFDIEYNKINQWNK